MFGGRGFAKVQNFLNLFISNAGLIVVATGMTIVMITGGIDISVGSVVAMVCMMPAWMMERGKYRCVSGHPYRPGNVGCGLGLVQGFLVAYLKMQPFIVTLAGMFFARGMTSIISQEMISITNKTFTGIATFKMYLPFGGYLNKKGVMIYPYVYPSVIIASGGSGHCVCSA
ncbi:MAG: ABC transporter permease subunit [Enterocloster bolteae]